MKRLNYANRQGQSYIDMSPVFQRTKEHITREAKRILGEKVVGRLLKQNKRGQWSNDEIQQLIAMRKQKLPIYKIRMWIRRTKPRVQERLEELRSTFESPGAVEGPEELPPGLQEFLSNTRLAAMWQALWQSHLTETWKQVLREKSAEEWLSSVSIGIPEDVKKLLGGLRPPTWDEFESLLLIDTNDTGVYARLVTSREKILMANERYLYIGSADKYNRGLNWRMGQHDKRWRRLQNHVTKTRLKGGQFVTLMVMKMDDSAKKDVLDVRRAVTLAEAILKVWLGALPDSLDDLKRNEIKMVFPWDPQTLQYTE